MVWSLSSLLWQIGPLLIAKGILYFPVTGHNISVWPPHFRRNVFFGCLNLSLSVWSVHAEELHAKFFRSLCHHQAIDSDSFLAPVLILTHCRRLQDQIFKPLHLTGTQVIGNSLLVLRLKECLHFYSISNCNSLTVLDIDLAISVECNFHIFVDVLSLPVKS